MVSGGAYLALPQSPVLTAGPPTVTRDSFWAAPQMVVLPTASRTLVASGSVTPSPPPQAQVDASAVFPVAGIASSRTPITPLPWTLGPSGSVTPSPPPGAQVDASGVVPVVRLNNSPLPACKVKVLPPAPTPRVETPRVASPLRGPQTPRSDIGQISCESWAPGPGSPRAFCVTRASLLPWCERLIQVRLVSLGCSCGVKGSFLQLGRGSPSLPFDWIRTRLEGVLHYLRTDFSGFFDVKVSQALPGQPDKVVFRDYFHAFWHDVPTDASTQEKYRRRIKRFNEIDARSTPVLFVRSVQFIDELHLIDELLHELVMRFGDWARLLVIIDSQKSSHGSASVGDRPNLLLYFAPEDTTSSLDPAAPYCAPIQCGIDWVEGRHTCNLTLPSVSSIAAHADPYLPIAPGSTPMFEERP